MATFKNQRDILKYYAISIIACLLFILAVGNVLAEDLAPDTVYYSDIKSFYSVSFYDSDSHCTGIRTFAK